jgi:predicted acetyltransferase
MGFIDLTTDPDNLPSQKVITANGGVPMGAFSKGAAYGHSDGLRFRIELG